MRPVKFHSILLLLTFFFLGLTAASTITSIYSVTEKAGRAHARQLFDDAAYMIQNKLNSEISEAVKTLSLLQTLSSFREPVYENDSTMESYRLMRQLLLNNTFIYSMYYGNTSGSFLQLINTTDNRLAINAHRAPSDTAFILRTITGDSPRTEKRTFINTEGEIISSESTYKTGDSESPDFRPAERPWFIQAQQKPDDILITAPYIFNSLKKPGITASAAVGDSTVLGVDMTLAGLKSFLDDIDITEGTGIMILDQERKVLASNIVMQKRLGLPDIPLFQLEELPPEKARLLTDTKEFLIKKGPWAPQGRYIYEIVIISPVLDFIGHQMSMRNHIILITAAIFVLAIPFVLLASRSLAAFMDRLAEDAERIQALDYSGTLPLSSKIAEFQLLRNAFSSMKINLSLKTEALETALNKLERIIELGIKMSAEKDTDRLVETILRGAKEIAHADGGSLYLKKGDSLHFKIVLNDSLGLTQGGISGMPVQLPPVDLYNDDGNPNFHNVVSFACHKTTAVTVDDAYSSSVFDFSGTRKFDELNGYHSATFLTVPLKLQGSEVIGALQLINCMSDGRVVSFNSEITNFVEALSSLAAAVLYNRISTHKQDGILDDFLKNSMPSLTVDQLTASGSCARVMELTLMLSDAARKQGLDGGGRTSAGADERISLGCSAWLHRAGKSAAPEAVAAANINFEAVSERLSYLRSKYDIPGRRLLPRQPLCRIEDESLPVNARIMIIAELFDDLTSSDDGDTRISSLPDAVLCLNRMYKEGDISGSLFRLFLAGGICLEFSKKHLTEIQLEGFGSYDFNSL